MIGSLILRETLKHIIDKLACEKETRSLEDSPNSLSLQVHCLSIKFHNLENAGHRWYTIFSKDSVISLWIK